METQTKNRLVDTVEEGENGTNGESSTETYITVCKIRQPVRIYNMTQEAQIQCPVIT